eukprot:SAG11_NODE_2965_length_2806_cov_3.410787_2_plen_96_part_00
MAARSSFQPESLMAMLCIWLLTTTVAQEGARYPPPPGFGPEHNGGFVETVAPQALPRLKPHVLFLLVDDMARPLAEPEPKLSPPPPHRPTRPGPT